MYNFFANRILSYIDLCTNTKLEDKKRDKYYEKKTVLAICGCMLMLAACGNASETVSANEVAQKEETAQVEQVTPATQEGKDTQEITAEAASAIRL